MTSLTHKQWHRPICSKPSGYNIINSMNTHLFFRDIKNSSLNDRKSLQTSNMRLNTED